MCKEQGKLGAVAHIVATAREMNQGCPAASSIHSAMCRVNKQLDTRIELIAVVAANAKCLPQGPASALDWIASASSQIVKELRPGGYQR